MNILNSLTWRSLKLNRRRTIVTIIGIILSAAMICATITIAVSFQDLFVRRAKQTDGDFHATFYRVAPEQVKYLTEHAYTEKAMLSRTAGFALFEESTSEERPYFLLKEYDHTALRHMPISLTEGHYPEKAGEILLSEEAIKKGGKAYRIGDTITLDLGERLDPEGKPLPEESPHDDTEQFVTSSTRAYTITGFIAKPHFEHFSSAPGFTAVSFLEPPASGAAEAVNVSILGKKPRQLYDRVPEMAEAAGNVEYVYNNELLKFLGISKNEQAIAALNTVAGIIILLIIVGSVTVIYNAFAISVSERKKQFGLLASTGATPGQIRRSVFFEGLILGLIGIPLGVLSGIGGIGVTLSAVNRLAGELMFGAEGLALRAVISPGMVPLTAAFVALIIFISAYLPSNRAAAISPIEAIRQSADIKISGKTVKTSPLTRRIFGLEGELALKNLKRNRRRYRTTVFSLFISIVLFISFSTFINYALTGGGMYYQELNFDFSVMVDSLTPEEQTDLGAQVAALDGVERCTAQRTILTDAWLPPESFSTYFQKTFIDNERLPADEAGRYHLYFHLTALGEKEFETFIEEEGLEMKIFQDTNNPRAILINNSRTYEEKLTEYKPLRAATGDRLELSGMIDQEEGQETAAPTITVELGAVTGSLPLGLQHADLGWVDLLVSDTLFEATRLLIEEQGGITSYASGGSLQLYLITDGSTDLGEQLRTICEQYTEGLYIQDVKAIQREMKQTTTAVSIFLYGFITLITLIGVTNIFNTISTNVALRRREFAMLKSVGLTPGGFNKMINYESIFYGLKALLYGLPVSILITLGLYNGFGNVFGFAFFLPVKEILICIAGVFVIVFITMLHAGSKLKHDNIIDALKEENL
ncbi:MAG: ABC transporter permease [Firmicutes bacterium]|nr:ABC transporter permease [Bacillota bacterium]